MAFLAADNGRLTSEAQLIGGVLLQYVAARMAIGAVARGDESTPGRLALAQWLPIAATAFAAEAIGHAQMALALIFGSSVAAMSLVLGMTLYVGPMKRITARSRIWPMVLPVAILLALAGFRAFLTWYHAIMLLAIGAAILAVWLEKVPSDEPPPVAATSPPADWLIWLLFPSLVLAAVGALVTLRGVLEAPPSPTSPELLATIILSPLLLLAALGSQSMLAQHGHTDQAITSICGTVLLNLCVLLPGLILSEFFIGKYHHVSQPLPFPLIEWRLDAMLLVMLGFALVPMALGRWLPRRLEALLLVLVYIAYLAAQVLLFLRVV